METEGSGTGEGYAADSRTAMLGIDWTIRRDNTTKNITEKMRLVFESNTYDIDSVQELTSERRRGFLIIKTMQRGSVDV
jgi:head-tail adaptor